MEKEKKLEYIEYLLTDALEGGSNYWYYLRNEDLPSKKPGVLMVDAILLSLTKENGSLDVYDAEDEDELRDGIVGNNTGQQTRLVCPAKLILLGGQLYPYGVFCVLGNDAYVGNNQQAVLPDGKGVDAQMVDILLWLLTYQHE